MISFALHLVPNNDVDENQTNENLKTKSIILTHSFNTKHTIKKFMVVLIKKSIKTPACIPLIFKSYISILYFQKKEVITL